jgi:hypothetical protein
MGTAVAIGEVLSAAPWEVADIASRLEWCQFLASGPLVKVARTEAVGLGVGIAALELTRFGIAPFCMGRNPVIRTSVASKAGRCGTVTAFCPGGQ